MISTALVTRASWKRLLYTASTRSNMDLNTTCEDARSKPCAHAIRVRNDFAWSSQACECHQRQGAPHLACNVAPRHQAMVSLPQHAASHAIWQKT